MKFTVLINSFTINHVQYNRNIGIFAERLSDKNRLATFVGLLLLQVHVYLGSLRVRFLARLGIGTSGSQLIERLR